MCGLILFNNNILASNFRVRAVLARHSWLAYGEQPVENRIADAVPRKEIYKLLTHAGLVSRNEYPYA